MERAKQESVCTTLLVDPAPSDTFVLSSVAVAGRGECQWIWLSVTTVFYLDALLVVGGPSANRRFF